MHLSFTMKNYLSFFLGTIILWNLNGANLNAEPVFECDFEKDTCGFTNDIGHEARWERKQMNLGGRTGSVMVVRAGGEKKQIARLMTPILDGHWSNVAGCLSLELFTAGDGINAFRVKQQDDSGVLPILGVHTEVTRWRKYNLHIDTGDFIRFIFEASVNPQLGGTLVAIDNISFNLEDCKE